MTTLAIASLVTGALAIFVSAARVQHQQHSHTLDDVYLFAGVFGVVWAIAHLVGA